MIRRRFLAGAAGLLLAPAIVRAEALMPVAVPPVGRPFPHPIGTVLLFNPAGASPPPGWLPCDGRAYSAALFPELAAVFRRAEATVGRLPDLGTILETLPPSAARGLRYAIRAR